MFTKNAIRPKTTLILLPNSKTSVSTLRAAEFARELKNQLTH
jgi:hypothetical protein